MNKICFPISSFITTPLAVAETGVPKNTRLPVRYGLIESPVHGPVLIDTGHTSEIFGSNGWAESAYTQLYDPQIKWALEPQFVVQLKGFQPTDVKHIILTHHHAHHISGLQQFPEATVHMPDQVMDICRQPNWKEAMRGFFPSLLPQSTKLRSIEKTHPAIDIGLGTPSFAFFGDPSIVLVCLGTQVGVAVTTPTHKILYASNVSWSKAGYKTNKPPSGLGRFVRNHAEKTKSFEVIRRAEQQGWHVVVCHDRDPTPFDHHAPFRFANPYE